MKRKFEELRENLDEFVQQEEYALLVVACLSDELAYVVKFLQALEEKQGEHYFLVFPCDFASPQTYLDDVLSNLAALVTGANQLRAERGESPFPPLPTSLTGHQMSARARLDGVLAYLRRLLPAEDGHRVVVGLLPLTCSDYAGYCMLVDKLEIDERTRVVLCDDRSRNEIVDALRRRKADDALTFEVDFSTPALTDQLARDAANPQLPLPERMNALLQLAALDYSYKRYPEALDKYAVLHEYYAEQELAEMQAMCLLGTGDTLRAAGHPGPAKERLQQGIALAMEAKALPVLLNLLLSIHAVCMVLGQHSEACSYANTGTQVAAAVLNPYSYADFFEMRGEAEQADGKLKDALASYEKCGEVCKAYDYFHRWTSALERRKRIYAEARMRREEREVDRQLAMVDALRKKEAA